MQREVVILKLPTKLNIFMHAIICNDCELRSTSYPKNESHEIEIKRWMAFTKDTGGLLVSPDIIKQQEKSLRLNVPMIFSQSNEFKMKLFQKIPSMLNHSQDLKSFIEKDEGKAFFQGIFVIDEKVLEKLELNLKDIICNISKSDFSEKLNKEIFENCFIELAEVAKFTAYCAL